MRRTLITGFITLALVGGVPAVAAAGISNVLEVNAGKDSTCALRADGTARCWGHNDHGQLGNGTTTDSPVPVVVRNETDSGPLTDIVQVVVIDTHACALLRDRTARCWGDNDNGRLGDGTTTDRDLPVVVRKGDGSAPMTNVRHLYGYASYHTCARLLDTSARCWGKNASGQLGNNDTVDSPLPVPVLNAAGTGLMTNIGKIVPIRDATCARLTNNTVRCWGEGGSGQLGDGAVTDSLVPVTVEANPGTTLQNVLSIVGGNAHMCARLANTTVRCWGDNSDGQLGDNSTTNRSRPVTVKGPSGSGALQLINGFTAGDHHACARQVSGALYCWGANDRGQLGNGTTTPSSIPVSPLNRNGTGPIGTVGGLTGGGLHTCAELFDRTVRCWGANDYGQLGNGTTTDSDLPVVVS